MEIIRAALKKLRSSVGISIAGVPLAISFKELPVYGWLLVSCLYIGFCIWVVLPLYDKAALNSALFSFLRAIGLVPDSDKFRCCIYVPDISSNALQMVSDYMPDNTGSAFVEHFKKLDTSKGAVGRAFRTCQTIIDFEPASFSTDEEYSNHLVLNWGFTQGEARFINRTWTAICAIPIIEPTKLHEREKCSGVLYFATREALLLQDDSFIDRMESAAMLFEPLLRMMKR